MINRIVLGATLGLTFLFLTQAQSPTPGFTSDFQNWLQQNGYSSWDFSRPDIDGGNSVYGGKLSDSYQITREPVIFIHGNSDRGLGSVSPFIGWNNSISYFLSQGYTEAELYATTWGPSDAFQMANQVHSEAYLTYLRAFVEAVLAYTGASKVDVIGHSMGVTLGRKVLKGGSAWDSSYNLGASLSNRIDTFLGIAGGNWGLTDCYFATTSPTCNTDDGFYPGYLIGPLGLSSYLEDLNTDGIKEGSYVYSMFSEFDDIIGYGDIVYGQYTSQIPGQDGQMKYTTTTYTHMNLKDITSAEQLQIITNHKTAEYGQF